MPDDRAVRWAAIAVVAASLCSSVAAAAADESAATYLPPTGPAVTLADKKIDESSGLAASRRTPGVFWTHNDSGDKPRLYAVGPEGEALGRVTVVGAVARDWEDMAAFELDGRPWLLLADTGANNHNDTTFHLYIVAEPPVPGLGRNSAVQGDRRPDDAETNGGDASEKQRGGKAEVPLWADLVFSWPGASRFDCEAVAVCAAERRIYLATKHRAPHCEIFTIDLPADLFTLRDPAEGEARGDGAIRPRTSRVYRVTPKLLVVTNLMTVTAMDISPDGRRMALLSYAGGFEYFRDASEARPADKDRVDPAAADSRVGSESDPGPLRSWAEILGNDRPHKLPLPPLRQGEAICYTSDGRAICVTSEKTPAPLVTLRVAPAE